MRLPVQVEIVPYRFRADDLEILALHRVPEKGGFWQPVTGGLEDTDASEVDAAYRELDEELGVKRDQILNLDGLNYEFAFHDANGLLLTERAYRAEFDPLAEVTLSDEHDEMAWGTPEEIEELYKWQETKLALRALLKRLRQEGRL